MTVIHKEFISREITRHDILPLSFLKKSPYTGSKGGMCFRMEKAEERDGSGEDREKKLCFFRSRDRGQHPLAE